MTSNQKTLSSQRGFTLVEIMVVVLILGLLATIVGTNVLPFFTDTQEDKARFDVGKIDEAVTLYYMRNRRLPLLEDLITPDDKGQSMLKGYTEVPLDPWDNPYEIRKGENPNSWEVLSWGPDKDADTDDDISSRNLRDKRKKK